jgi:hypothetical protein
MLNLLNSSADKLQIVSSTTSALDVHASYADLVSGAVTPGRQVTAITSAATTDVVATPAASTTRNVKTLHVRNKGAASNDVTVVYNAGGTSYELIKVTLRAGDQLEYVEGVGFFTVAATNVLTNKSTSQQGAGFAADTYLSGSFVTFPSGGVGVGAMYVATFDMTKTAAGTATPIVTLRVGTAGTTSDTARCTFTFSAGTAATDTGVFSIEALFRTVGSGTSAVLQGRCHLDSQPTTGLSSLIHSVVNTSAGFDSTPAGTGIGLSFNGGASFSGTNQLVEAQIVSR